MSVDHRLSDCNRWPLLLCIEIPAIDGRYRRADRRTLDRLITHIYRQQGRLNQRAHWARAHGPGFFSFEGPQPLAVVK